MEFPNLRARSVLLGGSAMYTIDMEGVQLNAIWVQKYPIPAHNGVFVTFSFVFARRVVYKRKKKLLKSHESWSGGVRGDCYSTSHSRPLEENKLQLCTWNSARHVVIVIFSVAPLSWIIITSAAKRSKGNGQKKKRSTTVLGMFIFGWYRLPL